MVATMSTMTLLRKGLFKLRTEIMQKLTFGQPCLIKLGTYGIMVNDSSLT